jgi:methylase of polypeptide subunit release factors
VALRLGTSCGSGAVFVYLATELQKRGTHAMFLATDLNPLAAQVATRTAQINGVNAFDIVRTDLLQCYEQQLKVSMNVYPQYYWSLTEPLHFDRD